MVGYTLFYFILLLFFLGSGHNAFEDSWEEIQSKMTIRAENEVEANKLVNNYRVSGLEVFNSKSQHRYVTCVCLFVSLVLENGRVM